MERIIKLNIGCGNDIRSGYVNIEGNEDVKGADIYAVIDGAIDLIISPAYKEKITEIVAYDFVEHLQRSNACEFIQSCYRYLKVGGILSLRLPDFEVIMNSNETLERKIWYLFGGQADDFKCHKYAYTKEMMRESLEGAGFTIQAISNQDMNMIITAIKG